jgi:oxalate decarboxylase
VNRVYFSKGHSHAIQTIGDKPCHFILSFDNGAFSEHGTFSITDWIDVTPKDILAANFRLPKDLFDAFPKGETYIQAGPVLPVSQALDAPWPRESTHKFRLLRDQKAQRDFEGGTFRLATIDEFPASKTMAGGLMTISKGKQRNLHWHPNAKEWEYYLRGKGQVVLFGSGGRSKLSDVKQGDAVYIPAGFGHAIRNTGDDDLEIVQTWDNGKFEEIDLDQWYGRARLSAGEQFCRRARVDHRQDERETIASSLSTVCSRPSAWPSMAKRLPRRAFPRQWIDELHF